MPNDLDFTGRPFHFIGIGGIGMSALAYVLAKKQLPVSGSDLRSTHITERLEEIGAYIFKQQQATNLDFFQSDLNISHTNQATLPQVICSTAINSSNLEYQAAIELGCPLYHRSDLLAALIRENYGIGIAGTHGKTTTSSIIGYILLQAGLDPTIIVGGEVKAWEGNARLGQGKYLVAEADESDGTLVKLKPVIGVITNIEHDHPDHFKTIDDVIDTFQIFANDCQILIGSIDCPIIKHQFKPDITYSLDFNSNATYKVDQVSYDAEGTTARVWEKGQILGMVRVKLLGSHNLSNSLAAIAVVRYLGLELEAIAPALATFDGAKRRFELKGIYNQIHFIDDYAHHPSEIQVTLAAARLKVASQGRVVAIFQPHRYTRITSLLSEFAQSFTHADVVVITDIYSAGEPNLTQVTPEIVVKEIQKYHSFVYYSPLENISKFLIEILQPFDYALFLGAGNLNQKIPQLMEYYLQLSLANN